MPPQGYLHLFNKCFDRTAVQARQSPRSFSRANFFYTSGSRYSSCCYWCYNQLDHRDDRYFHTPTMCSATANFRTGIAITPPQFYNQCYHTSPFYHNPLFITPQTHLHARGCADVLSHTLVYHTPASCTLSPGLHKIPPLSTQDTTPGDDIFEARNVFTAGCGFLCSLRY